MKRQLNLYSIYRKLFAFFGPQHWWPAKTAFEVIVGAILTQNTSWSNVEKAIHNLKQNRLLTADKLYQLSFKKLTAQIKSTGYYNIKAKRIREFLKFFLRKYQGKIEKMTSVSLKQLRQELLSINGVGPETADSILLYALHKPIFVVDAYTKRILLRHDLIRNDATYQEVQDLFMRNLRSDMRLFNEYHALLVKLGKDFCLKNKPKCKDCPLSRCAN